MTHNIRVKVYYEDTDAGGVVYYANYLRYLERGRTELLAEAGVDVSEHHRRGFYFLVARVEISYRRSARLGDLIDIVTEIEEMRKASVRFRQEVKRDDELLAEAVVTLAYADSEGRPTRIPDEMRSRLGA